MPSFTRRSDGRFVSSLIVNGHRHHVYGSTNTEITTKLKELDAGAQKGTVRVPSHQTVETYLKWCLESMQPSLKPTTYTSYDEMSCRDCEIITQAPLPWLTIERGLPGSGLLAHVLTSKYCDHLPLHRQSVIYAREGVELERSTVAGWVGQMAALLTPLSEAIASHVRDGRALHADDSLRVL